jgi:hypothetical protein
MSDTTGNALALPTESSTQTTLSETPSERLGDGRFAAGHHCVSPGRPRGSRNRATIAVESLMEDQAEALGGKMIDLAMSGNTTALKFCLERVTPRMKSRRLNIELSAIQTPADVSAAMSRVIEAAACGDIDVEQARSMTSLLDMKRKCLEAVELEERMVLIEKKISRDVRAL